MAISENLKTFLGKQVVDWKEDSQIDDPDEFIYRIRLDEYDTPEGEWVNLFNKFVDDPKASQVSALVLGIWSFDGNNSSAVIESLVSNADRLFNLKALFFGDITFEEQEISWIQQRDIAPLLNAYPKLEHLTVRGGSGLEFSPVKHYNLKTLIVQTGGLPKEVIKGICESELPELEHLELWLGVDWYGGNSTTKDLKPILFNNPFSKLKYLGLCDSKYQDSIAEEIANAPIINNLETLNLSMGTLTDKGADVLVNSPAIKKLKKLDLHHSYLSDEMVNKLTALGVELDLSDRQTPSENEDDYYVAVSE